MLLQVDIESNALTLSVHREELKQDGEEGKEGENQETEKGKKQKASDSGPTWHCAERLGVFSKRRVRLPKHADTSAARASYTDGVLTIQVPKKPHVGTSIKLTIN
jgi:HSP20 family molecular chaperone IbpA